MWRLVPFRFRKVSLLYPGWENRPWEPEGVVSKPPGLNRKSLCFECVVKPFCRSASQQKERIVFLRGSGEDEDWRRQWWPGDHSLTCLSNGWWFPEIALLFFFLSICFIAKLKLLPPFCSGGQKDLRKSFGGRRIWMGFFYTLLPHHVSPLVWHF